MSIREGQRTLRRHVWIILALPVLHAASPVVARALDRFGNAFVDVDPHGVPMQFIPVTLQGAKTYEFDTANLEDIEATVTFADSVMSLRDSGDVNAVTLAGADSCDTPEGPFEFERSCFRWGSPAGPDREHFLWLRAWDTTTAGKADVRYRTVCVGCGPGGTDTYSAWQILWLGVSFGGLVVNGPGPEPSGPVRFETTVRPGSCRAVCTSHVILFAAGDNWDTTSNWNLIPNDPGGTLPLRGGPDSHRRDLAAQTAEWAGLGQELGLTPDASTVLAGPMTSYCAGPLRLIRNDWADAVGVDADGDELGADLEVLLRTCDDVSSPDAGGIACSTRSGCGSPGSALCRASLRDSDRDGIRDDAEVYGARAYYLPCYGAEPSRYDLFVEVDVEGVRDLMTNDCNPDPANPPYTTDEAIWMTSVYRNLPGIRNRDWTGGIYLHLDLGFDPDDLADTRWGDFGFSQVLCPGPGEEPVELGYDDKRGWIFLWQYKDHGGCGGGTPILQRTGGHGCAYSLVHEVSHSGGLDHYGPYNTTDRANGKPHYWSRANYAFEGIGDFTTGVDVDRVSFSDGRFAELALDPQAVAERCPLGDAELDLVDDFGGRLRGYGGGPFPEDQCYGMDWDRNGTFAPLGSTRQAAILLRDMRVQRRTLLGPASTGTAGGALAVAGDVLAWLHVRPDIVADNQLAAQLNFGFDCPEDPPEPCWNPDGGDDDLSLILGHAGGGLIEPSSVAAHGSARPNGTPVIVVVYVEGSALRYGTLDGWSSALAWNDRGPVPGALPLAADAQEGTPALARIGTTTKLRLVYRTASNQVAQQQATIGAATITWTTGAPATNGAGTPLVSDQGAPGVAQITGTLGNGVVMLLPRATGAIEVHRQTSGSSTWVARGPLPGYARGVRGRPSVTMRVYPTEGSRVLAFWLANDAGSGFSGQTYQVRYVESRFNSTTTWHDVEVFHDGTRAPFPPPVVYDGRTGTQRSRGVRLVRAEWKPCIARAECAWWADCVPIPGSGTATYCTDASFARAETFEQYLEPFGDGVFPAFLHDYDDQPMLEFGYCYIRRACVLPGDEGEPCTPEELRDHDDGGTLLTRATCTPEPVY